MVSNNKKKRKNKMKRSNQADQLHSSTQEKEPTEELQEQDAQPTQSEPSEDVSRKRELDDDSDREDKPRKKKKKKQQPIPETSGDKKGKKSIRQMKKERHAQRQAEAQAASKDQLKTQCLSYLSQWKHDRPNWKFMKVKQVWLLKNKFSSNLVPDSSWKTLLEYFEPAKGNIRTMLQEDANKVIKQMDEWTETHQDKPTNDENDAEDEAVAEKPDETSYKRARDILQFLQ